MNRALALLLLFALPAGAVDISGALNATYLGLDQAGLPQMQLTMNLQCALTCPTTNPELRFGALQGVAAHHLGRTTDLAGFIPASFGANMLGLNSLLTTSFPPGSAFVIVATDVSCWCGSNIGQGGRVTFTTPTLFIPPKLSGASTGTAGQKFDLTIDASPKYADTLDLHIQGAGLNETRSVTEADFSAAGQMVLKLTPTAAGTLTVSAVLNPYGGPAGTFSTSIAAAPAPVDAGTGGGGGSTGTSEPLGCSTAPSLSLGLLALVLRRRAAS